MMQIPDKNDTALGSKSINLVGVELRVFAATTQHQAAISDNKGVGVNTIAHIHDESVAIPLVGIAGIGKAIEA